MMYKSKVRLIGFIMAVSGVALTSHAQAAPISSQGFETDTAGWFAPTEPTDYGSITRLGSDSSFSAFEGDYYANVQGADSGPYTFFGGAGITGPVEFTASLAVYLDLEWLNGEGFDYSVAANRQSGTHLRDFIFHTFRNDNGIVVGGSNNSNFAPRDSSNLNHFLVESSGWYIFEHHFYNSAGSLAVDLNLRADDSSLLFTETRNNVNDDFDTLFGGNRYGWFTHVSVEGGVNIDAVTLSTTTAQVPAPATIALLGAGLLGLRLKRRRA